MLNATSRDTVRSAARTGKPSRQLRSAWHDAWEAPESPGTLPMPLMSMLSSQPLAAAEKAADAGNRKACELVTYFVGQGVGLINEIRSARTVVEEFKQDFAQALDALIDVAGGD
jgi:NAD(P)H-dependent flavin oxidoreductase YrpB (nitropropane dioxygenase family)